jgi:hypothetical protein
MDKRVRLLLLPLLLLSCCRLSHAADSRFDLIGPKIDVRVTRNGQTLPIAAVPNLQPGDKLWIHPDLPTSQSVHYLLICVFLRGNTNPPPDDWFFRIETWDPKVRDEGAFVTVPADAQQAVMFMAPETGGDFKTLKSAVRGRPGAFVRASQDLIEAGFEEARIEKYIASIRRVPPADSSELLKHSDLLARTLALKPNEACFKQPVDMQFTCLTQTGSQIVLDDGNAQTISNVLNGPTSDLISQATYTSAAGGGLYSAYVGAIVDVVRIMSNLHTAQYQYIPAISFPQDDAMNLRLNTPPSFHNPKSVLVIALPAVQPVVTPPLRPTDPNEVTCLIKPSVVLPIEGAPLVFSTDFAHDMVLHLNTPPGAPSEPDIPLTPDPYYGGLVLQKDQQHHIPLHDPTPLQAAASHPEANPFATPSLSPHSTTPPPKPQPKPALLSGVILGRWGFDSFTGPTVQLQQLPGTNWVIVPSGGPGKEPTYDLIAGHTATLLLNSTGSACVHTITANPVDHTPFPVPFKPEPKPDEPNVLALTLPLEHDLTPGDLHLAIQQYDQPKADQLSARTFSEPATVTAVELHAGDKTLVVTGTRLGEIEKINLGDLVFSPAPDASYDTPTPDSPATGTLHFALPPNPRQRESDGRYRSPRRPRAFPATGRSRAAPGDRAAAQVIHSRPKNGQYQSLESRRSSPLLALYLHPEESGPVSPQRPDRGGNPGWNAAHRPHPCTFRRSALAGSPHHRGDVRPAALVRTQRVWRPAYARHLPGIQQPSQRASCVQRGQRGSVRACRNGYGRSRLAGQ